MWAGATGDGAEFALFPSSSLFDDEVADSFGEVGGFGVVATCLLGADVDGVVVRF